MPSMRNLMKTSSMCLLLLYEYEYEYEACVNLPSMCSFHTLSKNLILKQKLLNWL